MNKKSVSYVLMQENIYYDGLCLQYQLRQNIPETTFLLSVRYKNDFAEIDLGDDLCFASDCYRLVRNGGVTPCTLADVVDDLRKEVKNL